MSGAEILFAVASAGSAYASVQAGRAQAGQYRAEARQVQMQARDTEIARRQRLLQAMAERQVATAAGGATMEGTPGVLINESERMANLDALSLEAQTKSKVSTLNAAARNARTIANINAGVDILKGASALAGGGGGGGGKGGGSGGSGAAQSIAGA